MEFINRVTLRGIVGRDSVVPVGDTFSHNLSVFTEHVSHDAEGCATVEDTWHVVRWLSGRSEPMPRGTRVEVNGRLRVHRYVDAEGRDAVSTYIYAQDVTPLED